MDQSVNKTNVTCGLPSLSVRVELRGCRHEKAKGKSFNDVLNTGGPINNGTALAPSPQRDCCCEMRRPTVSRSLATP